MKLKRKIFYQVTGLLTVLIISVMSVIAIFHLKEHRQNDLPYFILKRGICFTLPPDLISQKYKLLPTLLPEKSRPSQKRFTGKARPGPL